MKTNHEAKQFDCLQMKHQVQEGIQEQIQGMSPAEEIAFFKKRSAEGPFAALWDKLEDSATQKTRSRTRAA